MTMNAGDIRNELKEEHGIDEPDVIAWESRSQYYVVGKAASDLPTIKGFDPADDPNITD